jgi:ribonuclease T
MKSLIAQRFRGFLPVVVDVETAGFNADTDALLEVAVVILDIDEQQQLTPKETRFQHILPFAGAELNEASLKFIGISDPYHPLRYAVNEKKALNELFVPIHQALKKQRCSRAILIGHNAFFDLGFINAAVKRTQVKSPFHAFSTLDTVTLSALYYGQTVLARSVQAAGLDWDNTQAHSAVYDAERTAALFCHIVNQHPLTSQPA